MAYLSSYKRCHTLLVLYTRIYLLVCVYRKCIDAIYIHQRNSRSPIVANILGWYKCILYIGAYNAHKTKTFVIYFSMFLSFWDISKALGLILNFLLCRHSKSACEFSIHIYKYIMYKLILYTPHKCKLFHVNI